MATVNNPAGELVLFSIPTTLADTLTAPTQSPTNAPNANGGDAELGPPPAIQKPSKPSASTMSKFKDKYRQMKSRKGGKDRVFVRVPRDEYNKYFARDESDRYIGTEPEGCEPGLEILRLCLENREMQKVGEKDVEAEIVGTWKPLKERSGWTHTAVSHAGAGGAGA